MPASPAAASCIVCSSRGGLRQQRLRLLLQQPAGVGEPHTAAVALEQLHPELGLEPADLLAQRRLGDVQALRGPTEVELVGNRGEVAQMAQLH